MHTTVMANLCICTCSHLCLEDKVYSLMIVSAHNKRGNIKKSYYYRDTYKH